MFFQPEGISPAPRESSRSCPLFIKQLLLYDSDGQVNLCQTRSCFSTKPQELVNEICTLDYKEEWTHRDFSFSERLIDSCSAEYVQPDIKSY